MILQGECQPGMGIRSMKMGRVGAPKHCVSDTTQPYAHKQTGCSDIPRYIIGRKQLWEKSGSHYRRDDRAIYTMSVKTKPSS